MRAGEQGAGFRPVCSAAPAGSRGRQTDVHPRGRVCLSRRRRALPAHAVGARGRCAAGAHARGSADEHIWFESVAQHAALAWLEVANARRCRTLPEFVEQVRSARPDFLFSFYYRALLGAEALCPPPRARAYNMHGSLLPKYRGRAPVNWAVLHGEKPKPAPPCMPWRAEPTRATSSMRRRFRSPDDTAIEVFRKVSVAAELTLSRALPSLLDRVPRATGRRICPPAATSGAARPRWRDRLADGVAAAHNLVRAVAPPYPGAYARGGRIELRILRTLPGSPPAGVAARPELRAALAPGELTAVPRRRPAAAGIRT